jgi:ABC-type transporter Mla maintaining outer membrane lipid asymmetry ATPase subunit MlaF
VNVKNPDENSGTAPLIEMIDATIAPVQPWRKPEVEHVNWRVRPRDFWVIAGLFGSGKSDFLATAAGLQRPADGTVKLFGNETFTLHEEALVENRLRVGMVFSGGGRLFNRLTVAENVALAIRYHKNWTEDQAEETVRRILELTGLIPLAHRIPSTLGPSWQQRAALARALVLQPEILLLDQPLHGMDLRHQHWWLDFLKKLSDGCEIFGGEPMTLVVTTENFEPWRTVGKQFAMLRNNRWQEIGGLAELDAQREPLLRETWAEEF